MHSGINYKNDKKHMYQQIMPCLIGIVKHKIKIGEIVYLKMLKNI